jgi:glycosyltransferase involved in cell wall biosynthesis
MKIAILTSGIMPVPAVQGGAVENLIDFYLAYNEQHRLHDITVYSVWHPDTTKRNELKSTVNHYAYIKVTGLLAKLKKKFYQLTHKNEYYHYTIEYFLNEALQQIRHQQYDLLIIENRPGYALKVPQYTKAPIVLHLHNDFLNDTVPHAKAIYQAADRIVSVSDYITNRVKTLDSNSRKCVTVYNGIDLSLFSPTTAKHIDRSQLSLRPDDFVIIYSGRINREKGIFELIQAIKRLDNPRVKLLVIGSSFYGNATHDDPFIQELKQEASPLKERITFTGFIPYPDMPRYLALADIAVIPSQWEEPFGLTCLEAMAMKLPVITTRKGGIPEIACNDNAILLDTGKDFIPHLADAIQSLYQQPERRKSMSEASLRQAQRFSNIEYARKFFEAIVIIKE